MSTEKTNVNPGAYLDSLKAVVLKAHSRHNDAVEANSAKSADSSRLSKDRSEEKVAKTLKELQTSISAYVFAVNDLIKQNCIRCDMYGIVDKSALPEICSPMVDKAMSDLGKDNVINVATMQNDIVSTIRNYRKFAKGKLSDGVSYFFNAKTGKLVLARNGVKEVFFISLDSLDKLWTSLCEGIKSLYKKTESKVMSIINKVFKTHDSQPSPANVCPV